MWFSFIFLFRKKKEPWKEVENIINARYKVKGVRHDPTSSRHYDALKF